MIITCIIFCSFKTKSYFSPSSLSYSYLSIHSYQAATVVVDTLSIAANQIGVHIDPAHQRCRGEDEVTAQVQFTQFKVTSASIGEYFNTIHPHAYVGTTTTNNNKQ